MLENGVSDFEPKSLTAHSISNVQQSRNSAKSLSRATTGAQVSNLGMENVPLSSTNKKLGKSKAHLGEKKTTVSVQREHYSESQCSRSPRGTVLPHAVTLYAAAGVSRCCVVSPRQQGLFVSSSQCSSCRMTYNTACSLSVTAAVHTVFFRFVPPAGEHLCLTGHFRGNVRAALCSFLPLLKSEGGLRFSHEHVP